MTQTLYASTWRHGEKWPGPKRYIAIVIYDNFEDFETACERNDPQKDVEGWKEAIGGFFPADTDHPHFAGTMRFVKGYIRDEFVIHECVHAAVFIYRTDCYPFVNLGKEPSIREEYLAYITGDLGASVVTSLSKSGVF